MCLWKVIIIGKSCSDIEILLLLLLLLQRVKEMQKERQRKSKRGRFSILGFTPWVVAVAMAGLDQCQTPDASSESVTAVIGTKTLGSSSAFPTQLASKKWNKQDMSHHLYGLPLPQVLPLLAKSQHFPM